MSHEYIIDLPRCDIFSAFDDDLFGSSGNEDIPIGILVPEITSP